MLELPPMRLIENRPRFPHVVAVGIGGEQMLATYQG